MLNFDNGIFDDLLGLTAFLVGTVIFVILLISSIQNYNKNRSYSIGAIIILCFYAMPLMVAVSFPTTKMNLIEFFSTFFSSFGITMSIALVFYFFMSCIRMLIERTS